MLRTALRRAGGGGADTAGVYARAGRACRSDSAPLGAPHVCNGVFHSAVLCWLSSIGAGRQKQAETRTCGRPGAHCALSPSRPAWQLRPRSRCCAAPSQVAVAEPPRRCCPGPGLAAGTGQPWWRENQAAGGGQDPTRAWLSAERTNVPHNHLIAVACPRRTTTCVHPQQRPLRAQMLAGAQPPGLHGAQTKCPAFVLPSSINKRHSRPVMPSQAALTLTATGVL